jgi:hypothetical protein
MSTPDAKTLLSELAEKPTDLALRERAARALQREGREAEAISVVTSGLRNLTAHEAPPLPCMCKRCLDPAAARAEAFETKFVRDFALAEGRVLFYWVPEELAGKRGLQSSVQGALAANLRKKRR